MVQEIQHHALPRSRESSSRRIDLEHLQGETCTLLSITTRRTVICPAPHLPQTTQPPQSLLRAKKPITSGPSSNQSTQAAMRSSQTLYRIIAICNTLNFCRAQQLSGVQTQLGYPGLTEQCKDAMRVNVSCPLLLNQVSIRCEPNIRTERSTADCNSQRTNA